MNAFPPVPCPEFPGFYEIPGFSQHAISPEGILASKDTGRIRKEARTNYDGYRAYHHVWSDALNRNVTCRRHRLLALAFLYPGPNVDTNLLEVNHINTVKGDDRIENLEWVTPKENVQHAWAMDRDPKPVSVSVRDVDTGLVTVYPTIKSCAKELGLSKDAVKYRMRSRNGQMWVYPERKQYREGIWHDGWYIPVHVENSIKLNGTNKQILLKRVLSGEVTEFNKLSDLADYLGMGLSSLSPWTRKPGQPVLPGYIQLKWAHDQTPWREVDDPEAELDLFGVSKKVQVVDTKTNDVVIYPSAKACAEAKGLLTTTLNWRLKAGHLHVQKDGCRYGYAPYPVLVDTDILTDYKTVRQSSNAVVNAP